MLALVFVGATSCGDDQKAKDAEIAALRQQLALQASGQGKTTVVISQVTTAMVTSYVQTTNTVVSTGTGTTSGGSTVTAGTGTTSTSTNTSSSSTSTSTAPRE